MLTHPSIPEIIEWAHDGTLYLHAEEFAFSLTTTELSEVEEKTQAWIDAATREMIISGYSDSDDSDNAKKKDTIG